jgi:hypothetical protein
MPQTEKYAAYFINITDPIRKIRQKTAGDFVICLPKNLIKY